MIKSLELFNWRSHGHSKIEFSKGNNIIIGNMGSGKTSIMDAISFALFGKAPNITKNMDAIKNRPRQERSAKVIIEIEISKDIYKIEREIKMISENSTSVSATLTKNNLYVTSQPERVNEEVERILNIDYDTFSKVIYSVQNQLDYILELQPSKRKELIDSLIGLDRFSNAIDNTTSAINKAKDQRIGLENALKGIDIEARKKRKEEIEKELANLAIDLEKNEKELIEVKDNIEKIKNEIEQMKKDIEKKEMLSKEIQTISGKIDMIRNNLEKAEPLLKEEASINSKKAELENKKNILVEKENKLNEEISRLSNEEIKMKNQESEYERKTKERELILNEMKNEKIEELENKLNELKNRKEALTNEIAERSNDLKNNEKWLNELENEEKNICPVCERELNEEERNLIIKRRKERIDEIKNMLSKYENEIIDVNKMINENENNIKRIKLLEEKLKLYDTSNINIDEIRNKIKELNEEKEQLNKEKLEIAKERDQLESEIRELLIKIKEINRLKEDIALLNDLNRKIEEKNKELNQITTTKDMLNERNEILMNYNEKRATIENSIEFIKKEKSEKEKNLNEIIDEINRFEYNKEKIKKYNQLENLLIKFRDALINTQVETRRRLVGAINDYMKKIWFNLYPYSEYNDIKLEPTDKDYILQVKIVREGKEIWIDLNNASGGEKSIACLSLRIALAMVLVPNLKWIILDEPTHNIDENGLNKFVNMISETLPNVVEQVFIITHDEILKQVANARIYQLKKDKETIIEEI